MNLHELNSIRFMTRIENDDDNLQSISSEKTFIPTKLINNCFSDNPITAESSLDDLNDYLHSQCTDEQFEAFCKVFPYDQFLEQLLKTPEGKIKTKAVLVFSCCSNSDFFPAKVYAANEQILSFFYSLLESAVKDEITSGLQILSQIMLSCPPVCQFLVENQDIHSELELIQATPQFSKMLSILCENHPQSLARTLSLMPFCFETGDTESITLCLLGMISAIKKVPECYEPVIFMIDKYKKYIFGFDIENLEKSGPYPEEIVTSDPLDKNKSKTDEECKSSIDEDNIQLALEIISIVPIAPPSLMSSVLFSLLKCQESKTILLCNLALRKQKGNWRGIEMFDAFLCDILLGQMYKMSFEIQKSNFETIMVYYRWDNEININLTKELIRFLDEYDMKGGCLFLLCHIVEVFVSKKTGEKNNSNDDQKLSQLIDLLQSSAFPIIEKIAEDPDEEDENSLLAQNFLSLFQIDNN